MIRGIENLNNRLQKSVLCYIAAVCDMSEDIEIEDSRDNIIKINDVEVYAITDDDIQRKLASYNTDNFEEFFFGLTPGQMEYVDEATWHDRNDITNFTAYLKEAKGYEVVDSDYYGNYNFYEIR